MVHMMSVSSRNISNFKSKNSDVEYWIALEPDQHTLFDCGDILWKLFMGRSIDQRVYFTRRLKKYIL